LLDAAVLCEGVAQDVDDGFLLIERPAWSIRAMSP
jgi:hypothetical protein